MFRTCVWLWIIIDITFGCQQPWTEINSQCYRYEIMPKDWLTSKEHCLAIGGHLVKIDDDAEEEAVKTFMQYQGTQGDPVWVGLTVGPQGEWEWSDGSPAQSWSQIQELPEPQPGDKLTLTDSEGPFNWQPHPGEMPLASICEKEPPAAVAEDTMEKKWRRIGLDQTHNTYPGLSQLSVASRIQCATACAISTSCKSFCFKKIGGFCSLLNTALTPVDLVTAPGWETWTKYVNW